jgi:hypothetical protein
MVVAPVHAERTGNADLTIVRLTTSVLIITYAADHPVRARGAVLERAWRGKSGATCAAAATGFSATR